MKTNEIRLSRLFERSPGNSDVTVHPLQRQEWHQRAIAAAGHQRVLHKAGLTGSGHILAIGNLR